MSPATPAVASIQAVVAPPPAGVHAEDVGEGKAEGAGEVMPAMLAGAGARPMDWLSGIGGRR